MAEPEGSLVPVPAEGEVDELGMLDPDWQDPTPTWHAVAGFGSMLVAAMSGLVAMVSVGISVPTSAVAFVICLVALNILVLFLRVPIEEARRVVIKDLPPSLRDGGARLLAAHMTLRTEIAAMPESAFTLRLGESMPLLDRAAWQALQVAAGAAPLMRPRELAAKVGRRNIVAKVDARLSEIAAVIDDQAERFERLAQSASIVQATLALNDPAVRSTLEEMGSPDTAATSADMNLARAEDLMTVVESALAEITLVSERGLLGTTTATVAEVEAALAP